MLKKSIILILTLLPLTAFCQQPDCYRYREGNFRIADTRAGVVTIAERKGMYQTESSEALKAVVRFRITWQSNCSYTLKLDKVLRNENKIDFPSNLEVKVNIIAGSGDSFTQEITSSLTGGSYQVSVTKLN